MAMLNVRSMWCRLMAGPVLIAGSSCSSGAPLTAACVHGEQEVLAPVA